MNRSVAPIAVVLLGLAMGGCLERRLYITSDPPGAVVWVNDVEVGRTPVQTAFTFYGEYDVRLSADGHEPLSTSRKAIAPWYEYPPIDLLAEAWPGMIKNEVRWHFLLAPTPDSSSITEQELLFRARQMRDELAGKQQEPAKDGS